MAAPASDIGYPQGHLGHLNDKETTAFAEFKTLLTEADLYKPGPPPSADDQTLLRYLRARRWVPQDALKQFEETEKWRKANHLQELYDNIEVSSYEQARQLYPQWTGRRDRRGIPLYLYEIRHLDSKTISAYEKDADDDFAKTHSDGNTPPKLLRLFALYENLTRFAQPLCTHLQDREHADTPITLSTNVVDVKDVGLRMFWNLKGHMQAASQLATAHYPETLDRIFICGAPVYFATVWGWISKWFDPITVSKIFVLSNDQVLPTLLNFIDIENIPKKYGGKLDFSWGDEPVLDLAVEEALTWENGHTKFPKGPMYWRPINDGKSLECIAVGKENGVDRTERVATMPLTWKGKLPAQPEEEAAKIPDGQVDAPNGVVSEEKTPAATAEEAKESGSEPATDAAPAANGTAKPEDHSITGVQGVQNLSIRDAEEPAKAAA